MKSQLYIAIISALLLAQTSPSWAATGTSDIQPDPQTPYYTLRSDRSVGERGEVHLQVSTPSDQCGEQWRFHSAEIVIRANRFGDAQFAALPTPGCTNCAEIVVRWMHEPTGHLEFDVNVLREKYLNPCEKEDTR